MVLRIGKGTLVTGPFSVDRVAYHSSHFIAWQQRLKDSIAKR